MHTSSCTETTFSGLRNAISMLDTVIASMHISHTDILVEWLFWEYARPMQLQ